MAKQIKSDYDTFLTMAKYERNIKPKTDSCCKKANSFNVSMTVRAYDIRSKGKDQHSNMEVKYGVRMTQEDENFYMDNCHGDYVAICTSTIYEAWRKKRNREEKRKYSEEKKSRRKLRKKSRKV